MNRERQLLRRCAAQLNSTLNGTTSMRLAEEIEELLAQPEPEPVAWMYDHHIEVGYDKYTEFNIVETCARNLESENCINVRPLYLAPPKREPLGVEEINECMENSDSFGFNGDVYIADAINAFENFARAIEKAHGIGE